jgi:F-type H+-transporting ATPase subunit delta
MAKLVSKVYGDALFESAQEQNCLDSLYEEVLALRKVFEEHGELIALLNHPQVVKEEKLQIISNVFQGKVSDEMMGFLAAVVEKGRQQSIPAIFGYFIELVKEYKKIGTADVTSAVPLTDAQKADVKERLLTTTRYVEFEMNYKVDPSLIGGLIIRIGDRVVDSSIKTQLYELKKQLLDVQLA